jgi:hypothetical protein
MTPWIAPTKLEGLACRLELVYQDGLPRMAISFEFFRRQVPAGHPNNQSVGSGLCILASA